MSTVEPRPGEPLSQSLEWWKRIMDAVPFSVLLIDEDHRVVACNESLRDAIGVCAVEGRFCPEVVHGCEGPYPGCPLEDSVVAGAAVETELYDEEKRKWMLSAVYPTSVPDERGRPLYLHFARDITVEKESSFALAQSLEHHKALGTLLQALRDAKDPEHSLRLLVDLTLALSWMRPTSGAAAFLVDGDELRLVETKNVDSEIETRCQRVALGSCVCGSVALNAKPLLASCHELERLPELHHVGTGHGHASYPLVFEQRALGVVNFYLDADQELSGTQRTFLDAAVGVTAAAIAQQIARREALRAQERAQSLERKLLERAIASQEEERKRVARELHDDLGQSLSALLLDLRTAVNGGTPVAELAARMEASIHELVRKTYQLAWDLRPALLDDFGLDSALARHISRFVERTNLNVDYEFICAEGLSGRMPPQVEIVLYRIAQEALTNVVRHSGATRASVIVFRRADSAVLLVEDDGCGISDGIEPQSQRGGGLGLLGVRERVGLLAGELVIESAPGEGTSIKVTLPIDAEVAAPSAGVQPANGERRELGALLEPRV